MACRFALLLMSWLRALSALRQAELCLAKSQPCKQLYCHHFPRQLFYAEETNKIYHRQLWQIESVDLLTFFTSSNFLVYQENHVTKN